MTRTITNISQGKFKVDWLTNPKKLEKEYGFPVMKLETKTEIRFWIS